MDALHYTLDALAARLHPPPQPTPPVELAASRLGVRLPGDMAALAAAYPGGRLIDYEQFPWDPQHPGGVVATTRGLHSSGLRPTDVALGIRRNRLYFWVPSEASDGSIQTAPLHQVDPPVLKAPVTEHHSSTVFYLSYTGLLLDLMEGDRYTAVRAALDAEYPKLTKRAAKRWRHRWAPDEVDRIDQILARGVTARDRLPSLSEDGREYVDLRGAVVDPTRKSVPIPLPAPPPRRRFERVDFSFGLWSLWNVDAHDCRFRAATMGCFASRFTGCDFSFVDVQGANQSILDGEFTDCKFTGAHLAECSLYGTFRRCDFTGADLRWASSLRADLHSQVRSQFTDCTWTHCRFGGDARHWDPMRAAAFPRL